MNFYKATGLREPRGDEKAEQDEDEDIEKGAFTRRTDPVDDSLGRDHRSEDGRGAGVASARLTLH